jgi:hypothetical protein
MPDIERAFSPIVESLRRAAAALRDADIPFAAAAWPAGRAADPR